jgi:hypothetical protein
VSFAEEHPRRVGGAESVTTIDVPNATATADQPAEPLPTRNEKNYKALLKSPATKSRYNATHFLLDPERR